MTPPYIYPNLTNELIRLYNDCETYNNAELANDEVTLSNALASLVSTLESVNCALTEGRRCSELRQENAKHYSTTLSLPFPDFYPALEQLAAAVKKRLRSSERMPVSPRAVAAAEKALENDRSARLMRSKYRGQSGKELFYQHIDSSLAVFRSLNLPTPPRCQLSVYQFLQTWGSTALGLGGVGGARITDAYTTVIVHPKGGVCVFFGSHFAYYIDAPTAEFYNDLMSLKRLKGLSDTAQYESRVAANRKTTKGEKDMSRNSKKRKPVLVNQLTSLSSEDKINIIHSIPATSSINDVIDATQAYLTKRITECMEESVEPLILKRGSDIDEFFETISMD